MVGPAPSRPRTLTSGPERRPDDTTPRGCRPSEVAAGMGAQPGGRAAAVHPQGGAVVVPDRQGARAPPGEPGRGARRGHRRTVLSGPAGQRPVSLSTPVDRAAGRSPPVVRRPAQVWRPMAGEAGVLAADPLEPMFSAPNQIHLVDLGRREPRSRDRRTFLREDLRDRGATALRQRGLDAVRRPPELAADDHHPRRDRHRRRRHLRVLPRRRAA